MNDYQILVKRILVWQRWTRFTRAIRWGWLGIFGGTGLGSAILFVLILPTTEDGFAVDDGLLKDVLFATNLFLDGRVVVDVVVEGDDDAAF